MTPFPFSNKWFSSFCNCVADAMIAFPFLSITFTFGTEYLWNSLIELLIYSFQFRILYRLNISIDPFELFLLLLIVGDETHSIICCRSAFAFHLYLSVFYHCKALNQFKWWIFNVHAEVSEMKSAEEQWENWENFLRYDGGKWMYLCVLCSHNDVDFFFFFYFFRVEKWNSLNIHENVGHSNNPRLTSEERIESGKWKEHKW